MASAAKVVVVWVPVRGQRAGQILVYGETLDWHDHAPLVPFPALCAYLIAHHPGLDPALPETQRSAIQAFIAASGGLGGSGEGMQRFLLSLSFD